MSTDPTQLCRTCLAQEKTLFSIFSLEDSENVADAIGHITDMTPYKSDGMPDTVCEDCLTYLNHFYIFKTKCLEAHNTLRNLLGISNEPLIVPKEESNASDYSNDLKIKSEIKPECSYFTVNNLDQENKIELKEEVDSENDTENCGDEEKSRLGYVSNDEETHEEVNHSEAENEKQNNKSNENEKKEEDKKTHSQSLSVSLVEQCNNQKYFQLEVKCPECNKGYKHLSRLRDHMKTHSTEKPYNCTICGKAFKHQFTLRRHMSLHKTSIVCETTKQKEKESIQPEPIKVVEKTQLPTVEKQVEDKSLDETHKLQLPGHDLEFQCNKGCKKVFKTRSLLARHIKIHSREKSKNHVCNICGKSYTKVCHLKTHLISHTNIKGFKCEQCNQLFARNSCLTRHLRIHTGDRPFTCDICHKSFPHAFTLEAHKRVHSEERPFKCDSCPMQFKFPGSLREHQRRHTGERPFSCELCPRRLSSKANFEIHMRTHKNDDIQTQPAAEQASDSTLMETETVEESLIKTEIN